MSAPYNLLWKPNNLGYQLKQIVKVSLRQSPAVKREQKYPLRLLLLHDAKIELYLICVRLIFTSD